MSLEVVNTVAATVTALVIAATAILALIQLRHLRAGNQIAGFMTLRNMLDDDAHQHAMATMVTEGDLTTEQGFREYVAARAAGQVPADDDRYKRVQAAVTMMCNGFETLGTLVRNGVVDKQLFLEQYCAVVLSSWRQFEPYIALIRSSQNDDGVWEDFEYMAVLSERFVAEHPSMYPPNMPRLLPSYAKKLTS